MEHYSKEGLINRKASADITRGAICVLNENSELALAAADADAALFVAEWDVKAGDILAAKIVGASTGTVNATVGAGSLVPGAALYLAADGKLATAGTVKVGFYLGEKKTTTAESVEEVALVG